jgi:hypothetical protein
MRVVSSAISPASSGVNTPESIVSRTFHTDFYANETVY